MVNENLSASILIVEDDSTQTIILKKFLEDQKFTFYFADNGITALDIIYDKKPDLVLCDWVMPGISGIDVCREIKSKPTLASTIFILFTGKNSVEDQVFGLEAGADDFLNKPVEKSQLLARIRAGLRQKQLYDQLQVANKIQKETQMQLVQTQKMSSLSRVVAGIAHEINNPANFIYGNIQYLQEYFGNLLEIIESFFELHEKLPSNIEKMLDDIDLEYLKEDLPNILASMKTGTQRISHIVSSLKSFSGLNETDIKFVCLNQCMDNTLSLMQHQLQEKNIDIDRHYQTLPKIQCDFRSINQAFMHLISNAIDAIESKQAQIPELRGTITIQTSILPTEQVKITVVDNGTGVLPEAFENIFDPFFTTKPIGSGAGLGLSVAYRIIQRHGGMLSCNSFPDAGAEFVIILPIKPIQVTAFRN